MARTATTARKATNISLPVDLCADAKKMGINISQVCEQSLRQVVEAARQRKWAEDNAAFIAEYNRRVLAEGVLLQDQDMVNGAL